MRLKYVPVKMPWKGKNVPHGIIEVNQKCNLQCDGCYKNKSTNEKKLEDVKKEIDMLISKRNVSSITLAGGEPTFYKDLSKVIRYISSKGIRPIILTNGTLLTKEKILEYKEAGVGRIAIHIDSHQGKRPDYNGKNNEKELNNLREKYLDLFEELNINSVLQLTLYKDNLKDFQEVIKFSEKYSSKSLGILVTLYSNLVDFNFKSDEISITNKDIIKYMHEKEKAFPTYYLPSSHDKKSYRWLFYNAFITIDKNKNKVYKMYFDPKNKFALKFFIYYPKILKGKYNFEEPRTEFQAKLGLFIYSFLSFSSKVFFQNYRFYKISKKNKNLKISSILFQQGPKYLGNGKYETCFNCPDATIRNNKLIPVCLVDKIEPL